MLMRRRLSALFHARSLLLLFFSLTILTWPYHHSPPSQNVVQAGSPLFAHLHITKTTYPTSSAVNAVCRAHGFHAYTGRRKVYDLVLLSTELDWLEIRLHTLGPYVDYFIVVESPTTFTGKSKPLLLKENWSRFKKFHSKIIHRVVADEVVSARLWDHEAFFRNSLLLSVFPTLEEEQQANHGDALIVSDIDELLRPETILLLRFCDYPARLTLRSHFYYYAYQWRHRGPQWPHPQATTYKRDIASTLLPEALRMGLLDNGWKLFAAYRRWRDRAELLNAGWHCSFCFSTIEEVQTKMQSFSHQEWNTEQSRSPQRIIGHYRNGTDLFNRPGEQYDKIGWMSDVPEYVMEQFYDAGRFGYLIDRTSGVHGNFADAPKLLADT